MSRTERLLNLTSALLHAPRPVSAEELHATIPGYPDDKAAFRRQFERDKDVLRQLGLPLTVAPLPGTLEDANLVGYQIRQEEYFLRDPGLLPDELSALHLAAQVVRHGALPATQSLWKLGLPVVPDARSAAPEVDDDALPILFQAIADRSEIEFGYRGERRGVVGRQLTFRNGHWYLAAYDRARLDDRSFRVDRIEAPVDVVKTIDGPVDLPLPEPRSDGASAFDAPWAMGDGPAIPTRIRIDAPQARWARERLGAAAVAAEHLDGGASFLLSVRNREALRSFVLGFLDHAVIESPAELRDDLLDWIDAGAPA